MFSKLFGKKKAEQSKQTQNKQEEKAKEKPDLQKEKPDSQKQKSNNQNRRRLDKSYEWIYEYILQYLMSPIWKNPIQEFIDEYCFNFEDLEENHFSYTDIHNKFIKMVDDMLENLILDIGINGDIFYQVVRYGLNVRNHRKAFEQIIIIDNFLVFKKLMLKRNKELELEAIKQLDENQNQSQGQSQNQDKNNMKILEMQSEQTQLDHAIEMSKAIELQRQELEAQEDAELQAAMAQSMLSYEQEQEKAKEVQRQETAQIESMAKQKEELKKCDEKEQQKKQDEQVQEISNEVIQKKDKIGSLPPLKQKTLDPLTVDEMINKRENLLKQLDKLNDQQQKESNQKSNQESENLKKQQEEDMRERKRRLQAQRDLILKKKQAERKEQTQEYQKQQNDQLEILKNKINLTDLKDAPSLDINNKSIYKQEEGQVEAKQQSDQKISEEEIQRRKDIMNKIKKQI